jgi:hypothetical protein
MDSRYARILIVLGSMIMVLLIAIVVVLLVEDDAGTVASGTETTEVTTAPTQPPETTEVTTAPTQPPETTEVTTAPTQPPPETTMTVPPMSAADIAVAFDGLHSLRSGDNLLIGNSPESAISTGWVDYAGPEFINESDGYVCGFGGSTDIFGPDDFGAMFMQAGLVRLYIWTPDLITAEGLGLGSPRADIEAVMGAPDDEQAGHYVATQTELRYKIGDKGILFVLDGDAVVEMSVGFWDMLFLVEGCL